MIESKYEMLYKDLGQALKSFKSCLAIDLLPFNEDVKDTLVNGQIQKFEYNIELLWKMMKAYFEEGRGIKLFYPMEVIKHYFQEEKIAEEIYLILTDAIKSRNLLSHVYKEEVYKKIAPKLNSYATAIETAYSTFKL